MKILTGKHVREADLYTIANEPVDSIDLMERASVALSGRISSRYDPSYRLLIVAGKGNNGGDGLAIARLMSEKGYACRAVELFPVETLSQDCRYNLERLPSCVPVYPLSELEELIRSSDPSRTVIIDAVLGTGVKGRVRGAAGQAIEIINQSGLPVVSIDLPSGLPTEFSQNEKELDGQVVRSGLTLTIEFPKLSLLIPETGCYGGEMEIISIGLSEDFKESADERFIYVDEKEIGNIMAAAKIKKRGVFSHKGTFGHTLLICGCRSMMGAALLATAAALRSGCGLVTSHIPESGCGAMNIVNPSAMVSTDREDHFSMLPPHMEKYTSVCIGCGLGRHPDSVRALADVMDCGVPMVIDADAVNLLSEHRELLERIPAGSVMTPHLGEFRRLAGDWSGAEDRISKALQFAERYKVVLLLKGAYTMIILPEGRVYVNSTGSAAMAKGGSGDVLAGYIAGLISRGCSSGTAAVLGVYRHGEAGDRCAAERGAESMNSSDIVDFIRY